MAKWRHRPEDSENVLNMSTFSQMVVADDSTNVLNDYLWSILLIQSD